MNIYIVIARKPFRADAAIQNLDCFAKFMLAKQVLAMTVRLKTKETL